MYELYRVYVCSTHTLTRHSLVRQLRVCLVVDGGVALHQRADGGRQRATAKGVEACRGAQAAQRAAEDAAVAGGLLSLRAGAVRSSKQGALPAKADTRECVYAAAAAAAAAVAASSSSSSSGKEIRFMHRLAAVGHRVAPQRSKRTPNVGPATCATCRCMRVCDY
jgi:hypothetical protein